MIPVLRFSLEVSLLRATFDLWSWVWLQNYKKIRTYYLVCIGLGNYVHIRKKPFSLWVHQVVETTLLIMFLQRKKCFLPIEKVHPLNLTCNYAFYIRFWLHRVQVALEISNPVWGDNTTVLLWLWSGGAAVWKLCFVEVQILKAMSSFLQLLQIKSFP